MKRTNNFTLVEIIAVLLIIAIMAAVAAPRFISLADDAKQGIAQAGVNEAKATLSVAYHKAYLVAGGENPTAAQVLAQVPVADEGSLAFGDITVTFTITAGDIALVGEYEEVEAESTWEVPEQLAPVVTP